MASEDARQSNVSESVRQNTEIQNLSVRVSAIEAQVFARGSIKTSGASIPMLSRTHPTDNEHGYESFGEVKSFKDFEPPADLSSFNIPENILRKIGNLAREAYNHRGRFHLADLSTDEWTYLDEILTGFENR